MTWGGGKPHRVGDHGQRYEVWYTDIDGVERRFGWTNNPKPLVEAINDHPAWHSPRVVDRGAETARGE